MKVLWISATLAVAALLCARPAAAQIGIVSVTGGRVEGVTTDGVTSFKGIPFAAPPVGNLRWREPQPVVPWSGVKKADRFAPGCMQDSRWIKLFGEPPAMSEDCLYLNVWTPARSARARLPVMVWIYGGGFTEGMTSQPIFDGTHLAQKGVVLVSVAYRLGAFGFLADPWLSAESSHHVSGNYGLRDMIAALEWVRANVAHFGGDPSRVTIFGESAGGAAVMMLAASPAAQGLYQRAISESGDVRSWRPPVSANDEGTLTVEPLATAEANGRRLLAQLGARDIAAARALPADVIQKGETSGLSPTPFTPILDGDILPGNEYELYQAGRFNDTPVLVGTNADEGRIFTPAGITPARFDAQIRARYGRYADAILAVYLHVTNAQAEQAARDVFRDSTFAWDSWAWALLQSEKGHGKVYLYYFDQGSPQAPAGPIHSAELGFVFDNLGTLIQGVGTGGLSLPPPADDPTLASVVSGYWVNFAQTGDPNGPGLPHWPAFNASSQRAMHLDTHPHAGPVPNLEKLEALDAYFAWLRAEAKKKQAH